VFAIDRSGIVGQDGETHQGQFDIALLRMMPNMTVLAPADEIEMRLAFDYAFSLNAPVAVRYPKGNCPADSFEGKDHPPLSPENALVQIKSGSNSAYIVIGAFVDTALRAAQQNGAAVLVLRMLKPIDDVIVQTLSEYEHITFIEDGCYSGSASEYLSSRLTKVDTECICLPDKFIEHGTRGEILKRLGF
jgi:1-deoxy-D-xylulose-5-phosphate synthase